MMYRLFIQGIVQGVGFRPYIYRKAVEHHLVGSVKNTGNGVEIIIDDSHFIDKLTDLPPLAKINTYHSEKYPTDRKYERFSIIKSSIASGETILPADIFMCQDCLNELKDPDNRRFDYYFITCTNCGPRFSMIKDYPYDRPFTSMNAFTMCKACDKEYTNQLDRRYHAQTIACKNCGPKLLLVDKKKDISGSSDKETIQKAISIIQSGKFVSIKGVGGFHICSLTDEDSVKQVRKSLQRMNKPFAIMCKDIDMVKKSAVFTEKEEKLLTSPQRPIVVIQKKHKNDFSMISELDTIGVMLPYTALHYLLFDFYNEPLLMTSCNIPGEPVSTSEKIGRYFLTHEREIVNRCDDSVLKVIDDYTFYLRRSRGYTPIPVTLPINCKDTIAVGAELNNVICTAKKQHCYLSQYIGETSKYETFTFFKETIEKFITLTRLEPEIIACDLHPTYNSTVYAKELQERFDASLIPIQHHKSHVASVAAEHHLSDYIGIAIDGLGYGEDGKIWGGEIFCVKDDIDITRVGHLEIQPQIGGDSATIYPKKMLYGILSKIFSKDELISMNFFHEKESLLYTKMLADDFNISYTSSTARILDAVASYLHLCDKRTYDGRPAILLESIATEPLHLDPIVERQDGKDILMTTPLFEYLLQQKNKKKGILAATAQMYLAKGLYQIARNHANNEHVPIVASGGVAYNSMITSYLLKNQVLVNKEIPTGDGGTCYGQAYLSNLLNK
jgi:hydrogenase maturation protein HypF